MHEVSYTGSAAKPPARILKPSLFLCVCDHDTNTTCTMTKLPVAAARCTRSEGSILGYAQ